MATKTPTERLAAAVPTGKAYRNDGHDLGNGDHCPVDGHGRMYALTKSQWCPHSDHTSSMKAKADHG